MSKVYNERPAAACICPTSSSALGPVLVPSANGSLSSFRNHSFPSGLLSIFNSAAALRCFLASFREVLVKVLVFLLQNRCGGGVHDLETTGDALCFHAGGLITGYFWSVRPLHWRFSEVASL